MDSLSSQPVFRNPVEIDQPYKTYGCVACSSANRTCSVLALWGAQIIDDLDRDGDPEQVRGCIDQQVGGGVFSVVVPLCDLPLSVRNCLRKEGQTRLVPGLIVSYLGFKGLAKTKDQIPRKGLTSSYHLLRITS